MSVKYTDNTPQLISERTAKVSLAIRLMLESTHRISIPITPKQHGNLRADVIKSVMGMHGEIIWDKEYALPQEAGRTHGSPMVSYTTAGTGPHFAQRSVKKTVEITPSIFKQVGL